MTDRSLLFLTLGIWRCVRYLKMLQYGYERLQKDNFAAGEGGSA